jgi:hypothetical protein
MSGNLDGMRVRGLALQRVTQLSFELVGLRRLLNRHPGYFRRLPEFAAMALYSSVGRMACPSPPRVLLIHFVASPSARASAEVSLRRAEHYQPCFFITIAGDFHGELTTLEHASTRPGPDS